MQPHRHQPTRLPHPWDSPGKNTEVGCCFLLQCMKVKSESKVAQSCSTLHDPMTAAFQALLSMGFSRQEYWSGVPLASRLNPAAAAAAAKSRQLCQTLCNPHRQQPTRFLHPWDSPGRNTKVGCHFLLQCTRVKSESEVAQLCPTLSDPMDYSLPGSSIHGILQGRVLEWVAIAFSNKAPTISKWKWLCNNQVVFCRQHNFLIPQSLLFISLSFCTTPQSSFLLD